MATLSDLRSRLRTLLNDNGAEGYLWRDGALDLHINDAILDYSRSCPREREVAIPTVAGQAGYDLPADCLVVIRVEMVGAHGSTPLVDGEWEWSASPEGRIYYRVYGGKVALHPAPAEAGRALLVAYLAPHAALSAGDDLSTVPPADEDLLLAFAAARALQGLSAEEAKRQRFGDRPRPAEASADLYWEQYQQGMKARRAELRTRALVR